MNAIQGLAFRALIVLCCIVIFSLARMDSGCESKGGTPTSDHSCIHKAK
jgi:hypothetical protein